MPSFEYQALDPRGKSNRGFIEADHERHARQLLRDRGLTPVAVSASSKKSGEAKLGTSFQRGVSPQQVALFSRQLATLVDSGIPIEEALQACADQTGNRRMRKALLGVRARVREGHPLSDGLAENPAIFSPLFCSLVHAGERSGELGDVLNRLADYLERSRELSSTLKQSMAYPAVLTLVSIAVVAVLMSYVVPKVVAQFDHVNQTLPLLTRGLIAASNYVQHYGLYTLAGVVLLAFLIKQLLKNPQRRLRWHSILIKLPAVGTLAVAIDTARLLRTLHILTDSGVPLLDAVKVAKRTMNNLALKARIDTAIEMIASGSSLNKALSDQQCFPPITVYMIANGEKSGELEQMLDKAATTQEKHLSSTFKMFVTLFEPALIMALGGVVLMIVLAILLPILQLNNLSNF